MTADSKRVINRLRNILVILVILVTFYVDFLEFESEKSLEQKKVTQELSLVRAELSALLYNHISLTKGMASHIAFNPNITQSEFEDFIQTLVDEDSIIRSIGAAKNLTITHVYPFKGNEKALGFAYETVPSQYATVIKTLELKQVIIDGPVNLVQGGRGMIARLPVLRDEKVWGVVSIVLDFDEVTKLIENSMPAETAFSIRTTNQDSEFAKQIYGDASIFDYEHIAQDISLPYGSWTIAAKPSNDWVTFHLHIRPWLLSFLVIFGIIYISNLRIKRAQRQTEMQNSLAFSEAKFRSFFAENSIPMFVTDPVGKIIEANKAAESFYGYLGDELSSFTLLKNSENTPTLEDEMNISKFELTTEFKHQTKHVTAHGYLRDIELFGTPIELEEQMRLFVIVIDITKQVRDESNRRLFEKVYQHSQEGIMVTDEKYKIIEVNPAFEKITGYTNSEVKGQNPSILKSGKHQAPFYEKMHSEIKNKGFWRGEIWNKTKTGRLYPQLLSISQVQDKTKTVTHFVAVFSDITQQKESEKQLKRLAHFDELTGLPNRFTFKIRLKEQIKTAKLKHNKIAILFIDLDRFKVVNDSLGHQAGDQLLVQVGQRISSKIQANDVLARLGGDEFIIMVTDYRSDEDLKVLAHDICRDLKAPFELGNIEVNVGASIGFSQYPRDSDEVEELIKFADASMYKAKKNSNLDYAFYDASITDEASSKLTIKAEIKRAIECNEFELHLQAQIDLAVNQIHGAEALIRWNHPTKGLLAPIQFINLAEETGNIRLITHWVIEQIFEIQNDWLLQGYQCRISANISASELRDPSLFDLLHHLARQYPSVPQMVSLEIVESALVEDVEETNKQLSTLRNLGFKIEIDDFGTGFSSLSYLGRLPVDALKIDKFFVQNMDERVQKGMVKSIIALAQNFDLSLVAEGIESEQHAKMLLDLGCTIGQGYFFSKPITQAEFESRFLQFGHSTLD